jgi:hypothetical protein
LPQVEASERLARYIFQRNRIRADLTIRPDAFVPHPWPDLSVTRHLQLATEQIWAIGEQVARQVGKSLHGRADVEAAAFISRGLQVRAAPVENNPNHANVTGWPADKPAQKILAQEIAAAAGKATLVPSDATSIGSPAADGSLNCISATNRRRNIR